MTVLMVFMCSAQGWWCWCCFFVLNGVDVDVNVDVDTDVDEGVVDDGVDGVDVDVDETYQ